LLFFGFTFNFNFFSRYVFTLSITRAPAVSVFT
jgi:hypothetical protein